MLPSLVLHLAAGAEAADDVEAFLAEHWGPEPAAGVAANDLWGPLESSLTPEGCGACHPGQLADWGGSRHAHAMSPGVLMQLLDAPDPNGWCQDCHAPLAEQRLGTTPTGPGVDLRGNGLICASCHVRHGTVTGPPRDAERPPLPERLPHGGFAENAAFEDSRFCAGCHQFGPDGYRIAGTLLENTWAEWRESPFGSAGQPCQSCHMPDRRHLWRGIHDPEATEAGLDIALTAIGRRRVRYEVTNARVGHRFPTYVTPRVTLVAEARSADREVLARGEQVVQRSVDLTLTEQAFDTRLAPGESAILDLAWTRAQDVAIVEAWLLVEPDEYYARFYGAYRASRPETEELLRQARADAELAIYRIGRRTLVP